jgi:hypothetical protein
MRRETLTYGLIFMVLIGLITLFLPVELYDGYAVLADGTLEPEKLSLSYFVQKNDFLARYKEFGVVDLKMNTLGWILVGIVNFAFPMLLGYRVSIAKRNKRDTP